MKGVNLKACALLLGLVAVAGPGWGETSPKPHGKARKKKPAATAPKPAEASAAKAPAAEKAEAPKTVEASGTVRAVTGQEVSVNVGNGFTGYILDEKSVISRAGSGKPLTIDALQKGEKVRVTATPTDLRILTIEVE